jgi:exonuclease SbcC
VRISRLYLRNYRVYEDELDLPLPAGLVGIYGNNGSGKSSLIESIRFTLYGKARTSIDEIRTSGTNGECVTEVEFEHEGHLYLVRRKITGVNHTVKAEAHWNGQQVAEGVRDTATYVHSVLGMDDAAFRASVFAEQKQVAAFSSQTPQKRRDLVLRLLGITPLDHARDTARADARNARADHERLAQRLPDLDELATAVDGAAAAAETVTTSVAESEAAVAATAAVLEAAETELARLNDVHATWSELMADGRAAAAALKDAEARVEQLTKERADLRTAGDELVELRKTADGLDALELRLRNLEVLDAAKAALAALPSTEAPPAPDDDALAATRERLAATTAAAGGAEGAVRAATAELQRAEEAAARSADLSADEDCPVCGQSLGHALGQVRAHRTAEVKAAKERLAAAKKAAIASAKEAKSTAAAVTAAERQVATARTAHETWARAAARRADAESALAAALAVLDPAPVDGEADEIRRQLATKRTARQAAERLEGRLERLPVVESELVTATALVETSATARDSLREKVKALDFSPEAREAAVAAHDAARAAHRTASAAAEQARMAAAAALTTVTEATTRLTAARELHAEIAGLADQSRHLGRLSDLLSDFRNNVVATVGPRLAAQAADLFGELTDNEYDRLEVDADTYDIRITDAGRSYGMDRFSGSETDLANLALRVAISEQVRFQSGGAVGLLVLDEVFGPLDEDRKERMLLALERLRGRFRQVLVVTHDASIKEQLGSAIQVQKLPGRRATAVVMSGV